LVCLVLWLSNFLCCFSLVWFDVSVPTSRIPCMVGYTYTKFLLCGVYGISVEMLRWVLWIDDICVGGEAYDQMIACKLGCRFEIVSSVQSLRL
jgi:hypothetical protein